MTMNLKPLLRYQLRDYAISCLTFFLVNVAILSFLALALSKGHPTYYSGYSMGCGIFLLVYGIVVPRQVLRLGVQMGVSRRTSFLSLLLTALLAALILTLLGHALITTARQLIPVQKELVVTDLYSVFYLNNQPPTTLDQHGMTLLLNAVGMLACFAGGLFFTTLFWRLSKVGSIIAAISIPALLVGGPWLLYLLQKPLAPVLRLLASFSQALSTQPGTALATFLIATLLFTLVSWCLVRNTNIRSGTLSAK